MYKLFVTNIALEFLEIVMNSFQMGLEVTFRTISLLANVALDFFDFAISHSATHLSGVQLVYG